uniref:hypothetical protein n=1 Tax=uncultured Bacteroides sp. TaxID=162156 RepID=UPI0027300ED7
NEKRFGRNGVSELVGKQLGVQLVGDDVWIVVFISVLEKKSKFVSSWQQGKHIGCLLHWNADVE